MLLLLYDFCTLKIYSISTDQDVMQQASVFPGFSQTLLIYLQLIKFQASAFSTERHAIAGLPTFRNQHWGVTVKNGEK